MEGVVLWQNFHKKCKQPAFYYFWDWEDSNTSPLLHLLPVCRHLEKGWQHQVIDISKKLDITLRPQWLQQQHSSEAPINFSPDDKLSGKENICRLVPTYPVAQRMKTGGFSSAWRWIYVCPLDCLFLKSIPQYLQDLPRTTNTSIGARVKTLCCFFGLWSSIP